MWVIGYDEVDQRVPAEILKGIAVMELIKLSKVRRFALAAVASNLVLLAVLAAVLPHVLLPIAALALPLLTAAIVESALERTPRAAQPKPHAEPGFARVQRALSHAA